MQVHSIQTAYTSPSRSIRKPSYPYRPSLQGSALRENSKANGTVRYGATRFPRWVFLLGVLLAACARPSTPSNTATAMTNGDRLAKAALVVESEMKTRGQGGEAMARTILSTYNINLQGHTNNLVNQLRQYPEFFRAEDCVSGKEILARLEAGTLPIGTIIYIPEDPFGNMVVYTGDGSDGRPLFVSDFPQNEGILEDVGRLTAFYPVEGHTIPLTKGQRLVQSAQEVQSRMNSEGFGAEAVSCAVKQVYGIELWGSAPELAARLQQHPDKFRPIDGLTTDQFREMLDNRKLQPGTIVFSKPGRNSLTSYGWISIFTGFIGNEPQFYSDTIRVNPIQPGSEEVMLLVPVNEP